jgi:AraC-like DNA-binding protein/mannose-6-phosphate isomerase-like protein (cupin superfamily)
VKLTDLQQLSTKFSQAETPYAQAEIYTAMQELGIDPGNFYQELEMSYRFVQTHRDISFSNSSVQLHSHSFHELLYCRSSCGAEYLVGTRRYRLQRGDIVFVPAGISHRPLLPEHMTEPYKRYVLWLSSEFIENTLSLFPDSFYISDSTTHLIRTMGTQWEFLGDYFRIGVQESEQKKIGWEAAVLGNTLQLLSQLKRLTTDPASTPLHAEQPELLDQILAYVEKNYSSKITLADTARYFYVSEGTITQTFRKKMGTSFCRCVTQRRLIAAKSMIQDGISLENIAEQIGFLDYSTFYRAFRQEYGISPRQFKKML